MSLTQQEAAAALEDIAKTERRSSSAYEYKAAAPHLILWGLVWFSGYIGTYLMPSRALWIWLIVDVAGVVASTAIGMRAKPRGEVKFSWRFFLTWCVALTAISSVLSIFYPFTSMQIGTLFPLVIGWAYVIIGIWRGKRFAMAGLAIVALALFSFFQLTPAAFLLSMAFLGGAVLIGTGLWLRSV